MTIEELQVVIKANTSHFETEMSGIKQQLNQVKASVGGVNGAIGGLGKTLKAFVGLKVGQYILRLGKTCLTMAMDVQESENLFSVSMGAMAAAARTWSSELSEALGLNEYEVRKNVGVLFNMTTSMGLLQDQAYELSTTLTELIYDMSSFYNISTDEAFTKISAGLTGETEPLKRLGILVNENTIKQVAYRNGIATTGRELTEQEKVMARYIAIMEQTSNAQGDLARTIDSPANQLRRLQTTLQIIQTNLGRAFMPIAQIVLPLLNSLASAIARVTSTFATFMQALFGVKTTVQETVNSATSLGGSYQDMGNEAEKAGKKAKGSVAGFDEVNQLQQKDSSSSGGSGGGGVDSGMGDVSFEQTEGALDQIPPKIQAMADKVKAILSTIFKPFKDSWDKHGESVMKALEQAGDATLWLFEEIGKVLSNIWSGGGAEIFEKLSDIFWMLVEIGTRLYYDVLVPVGKMIAEIFDPTKSVIAKAVLDVVNFVLDLIIKALEWIGGDGYDILAALIGAIVQIGVVLLIAAGVMAMAATPIGLVVLGVIAIVSVAYLLAEAWEWLKKVWNDVWINHLQKFFTKEYWTTLGENIKDSLMKAWSDVWEWFDNTWFGQFWNNSVVPLFTKEYWTGLATNIKEALIAAWNNVWKWFDNSWIGQFWNNHVLPLFTSEYWVNVGKGLINGFKNIWKDAINGAIGLLNTFIDWVNDKLNLSIPAIEIAGVKIFDGFSKQLFSFPKIPKLARGGIVTSETNFGNYIAGESGTEMIVPLENTPFVNKLASALGTAVMQAMMVSQTGKSNGGGNMEIVLNVDGRTFARALMPELEKEQNRVGHTMLKFI